MATEPRETREQIEQTAATWIARRGSEGWTQADEASLQAWLAESAGHRVAFLRLDSVWASAARIGTVRRTSRLRLFAVAATVLVLIASTAMLRESGQFRTTETAPALQVAQVEPRVAEPAPATSPDTPAEEANTAASPAPFLQRYTTVVGATRTISLPDGSRITLDTDSQIRVSIDGRSRGVQLDRGQAYFEVAQDRERPFRVSTDRLTVTAVGTAFSVRWTAADVRVFVAEGTVRLEDRGLLPAGGIARVEADVVQIDRDRAQEVQRSLSWRVGVLTFRHTALSDAVAEFNRYNDRKILVRDPAIAGLELGGVFRVDDAEAFVRLLERTFPVDATLYVDRIELAARRVP